MSVLNNSWNSEIPVQVPLGGTGLSTFGIYGVLYSNLISPIQETVPGTNGQVLLGSSGAAPAFGTITSTGGTISFTTGANSLNMEAAGSGGFLWTEVTGTSQAMAVNSGYIANHSTLVTLTLPTVSAVGNMIKVVGKGAGGWTVTYTTNQIINFGAVNTTITTGSLSSTNQYDSIELVCTVANLAWTMSVGPQGNIGYV